MEGNLIIAGVLAPLFLLRRPLTSEERRSLRFAVALWVVGVVACVSFVAVNRHQLTLPVVLFGDLAWLLWAGLGALLGAGLCLAASDETRRREKERRFLRQRDGLPLPRERESPEEESRRLLAEVERLKREPRPADPGAAADRGGE